METIRSELAGAPVIIGGGLAGLMTALRLAPLPVILLAKTPLAAGRRLGLGAGRRRRRRGRGRRSGAACRRHPGGRRRALRCRRRCAHRRGGAGRHRRAASATASPSTATPTGRFALGLEAAHGRRRIVHVTGDGTGAAIMRALVAAVRRHALDHRRRGAGGAPPAGRRSRHCQACWRRGRGAPACWRPVGSCSPPAGWAVSTPTRPIRWAPSARALALAARAGAALCRHGVRAVPSDRARRRARSHAAGQRSRARRGRHAGRRNRRAVHGGAGPRRARAARRRLARRGRAHRRRPPRLPRCAPGAGRGLRGALPRHRSALPGRRHRSRDPADPGAAGGALPHGRHRRGWPRAAAPSKACGRAARRRRPACTAPIVWPATRCSRRW